MYDPPLQTLVTRKHFSTNWHLGDDLQNTLVSALAQRQSRTQAGADALESQGGTAWHKRHHHLFKLTFMGSSSLGPHLQRCHITYSGRKATRNGSTEGRRRRAQLPEGIAATDTLMLCSERSLGAFPSSANLYSLREARKPSRTQILLNGLNFTRLPAQANSNASKRQVSTVRTSPQLHSWKWCWISCWSPGFLGSRLHPEDAPKQSRNQHVAFWKWLQHS